MRAAVAMIGMVGVACGGRAGAPPSAGPAPAAAPVAAPAPAVAPAAPAAPAPAAPAPAVAPAAPAPAPAPSSSAPFSCRGAAIDLAALFTTTACRVSEHADAKLPAGVVASIGSPLRAKPGARAASTIVLTNTTASDARLRLAVHCGLADQVDTAIYDRAGARIDREVRCGSGMGCGGYTAELVLAPHGTASFPIALAAVRTRDGDDCKPVALGPIAPGTYRVEIGALFLPDPITAELHVSPR